MSSSLTGYQGPLGSSTGKQFYDKIPKGYKSGQLQQFTPEQMELFRNSFSHVGPNSFLSRLAGGDEEIFNQIEGPALKQFGQLQSGLASRFSGQAGGRGPLSSRKSSGFQNTLNTASQDFASQLQAQRMGLQRQALLDLMGISNTLLGQRPFEQYLIPKEKKSSGFGGLIGAGLGGLGGFFAGGPGGALTGAQLGYGIGSAF